MSNNCMFIYGAKNPDKISEIESLIGSKRT